MDGEDLLTHHLPRLNTKHFLHWTFIPTKAEEEDDGVSQSAIMLWDKRTILKYFVLCF